jgi:uncharacterized protein (DUF736 family)
MSNIGTFTKTADGAYTGAINTHTLTVKSAQFQPIENPENGAPDFRVYAGKAELGAAWKKTSKAGRDYLSVKLDDPSFPREIYASLMDADEGYNLIWSRSRSAR